MLLRDDRRRDNLCRPLGEDAGLGCADTIHVADGVDAREPGGQCLLVYRNPVVGMCRQSGLHDDLRHTMHGDSQEERVRQLRTVIEHGDADVIAQGKSALANPDWPNKVQAGDELAEFDFAMFNPLADLASQAAWEASS